MTEQKTFFSFKYNEPAPLRELRRPALTIAQILEWADAHHARTGEWPNSESGRVHEAPDEKWVNIIQALQAGLRGLRGGRTLADLLLEQRGVPKRGFVAPLTEALILEWADAHHARTGEWPNVKSGQVHDHPGEKWANIAYAMHSGIRGLPRGGSLARLLLEKRGAPFRNRKRPAPLTEALILEWADAHHARTGEWPNVKSGRVHDNPDEKWANIVQALHLGKRGLPRGRSLAGLLLEERGVPIGKKNRPGPLTEALILEWADAHHARSGKWPNDNTGSLHENPAEKWSGIARALRLGLRGLPHGRSLAQLLLEQRGVRIRTRPAPLTEAQILEWADAHKQRTGAWPTCVSGPVVGASGEVWANIQSCLFRGSRGLPGNSSIAQLLAVHRGEPNRMRPPRLTVEQILCWAEEHRSATGRWPGNQSGPIAGSCGETWGAVNYRAMRGKEIAAWRLDLVQFPG